MPTTQTFDVTGMTCGGCERALTRAVSRLPGVQHVTASHVEARATVTFDEATVTSADIAAAIRTAGYEPKAPHAG